MPSACFPNILRQDVRTIIIELSTKEVLRSSSETIKIDRSIHKPLSFSLGACYSQNLLLEYHLLAPT